MAWDVSKFRFFHENDLCSIDRYGYEMLLEIPKATKLSTSTSVWRKCQRNFSKLSDEVFIDLCFEVFSLSFLNGKCYGPLSKLIRCVFARGVDRALVEYASFYRFPLRFILLRAILFVSVGNLQNGWQIFRFSTAFYSLLRGLRPDMRSAVCFWYL